MQWSCHRRMVPAMTTHRLATTHVPSLSIAAVLGLVTAASLGLGARPSPAISSGSAAHVRQVQDTQAAVLPDGFAVMQGAPADRHAVALALDGQQRWRRAVAIGAQDARMVGTSAGVAVGYRARDKLELAIVTGDGEHQLDSTWGKRVAQLCVASASSDLRFGIGWIEGDGTVWMVHGNVGARSAELAVSPPEAVSETTRGRADWCTITSAGQDIAMVWREGRVTRLNLCSRKRCDGLLSTLSLGPGQLVEQIACSAKSCLAAIRDREGQALLASFTIGGKREWIEPLAATAASGFAIVAAGDRGFAVSYVGDQGAAVMHVTRKGARVGVWGGPATTAPALAWSRDQLLIAHEGGNDVLPMPR